MRVCLQATTDLLPALPKVPAAPPPPLPLRVRVCVQGILDLLPSLKDTDIPMATTLKDALLGFPSMYVHRPGNPLKDDLANAAM